MDSTSSPFLCNPYVCLPCVTILESRHQFVVVIEVERPSLNAPIQGPDLTLRNWFRTKLKVRSRHALYRLYFQASYNFEIETKYSFTHNDFLKDSLQR